MQAAAVSGRCTPRAAAFGGARSPRQQRAHQGAARRHATVAVAAVEEPATAAGGSDGLLDKDAAYARFESLLDQFAFSFATGDKVRGGRGRARVAARGGNWVWRRRGRVGGVGGWLAGWLKHARHCCCSTPSPPLPLAPPPPLPLLQVQGTIFRVDQRGAYVDVGGKSTAFCPVAELSLAPVSRVRASAWGRARDGEASARKRTGAEARPLPCARRRPRPAHANHHCRPPPAAVIRDSGRGHRPRVCGAARGEQRRAVAVAEARGAAGEAARARARARVCVCVCVRAWVWMCGGERPRAKTTLPARPRARPARRPPGSGCASARRRGWLWRARWWA